MGLYAPPSQLASTGFLLISYPIYPIVLWIILILHLVECKGEGVEYNTTLPLNFGTMWGWECIYTSLQIATF